MINGIYFKTAFTKKKFPLVVVKYLNNLKRKIFVFKTNNFFLKFIIQKYE